MVPRNTCGLAYLAAHYRFGDCDQHVNPISEVIISPKSFYLISPPTYGTVHAYVLGKKRLPEAEAANLWKQMVCCVQDCHSKGIIIRDLKMGKFVFVDKERWVLCLRFKIYLLSGFWSMDCHSILLIFYL